MKNYWLFKAEPDVYGIEHLAAETRKIGRWDGIRNYQARNFLRDQVALGDKVFIYHSHCKIPGIVGSAKVVKTAYPDPTQFDPDSHYYDPKATPANPRWVSVDIELEEIFAELISLAKIKQCALTTHEALGEMVLLRQARLSVQPVKATEWKTIQQLRK